MQEGNPTRDGSSPLTVLIVEDEPLLRIYATDIISDAGYKTLEAPNADAAIRILDQRRDIEIVFTDINMPGSLDGLRLSHYIRERWPPVHLIITSGDAKPKLNEMPVRGSFLSKPFEPKHLLDALIAVRA